MFFDLNKALGVEFENVEQCMEWAFGPNWYYQNEQCPRNWNCRHGDLFMLHNSGNMEEDFQRIGAAWKDQNNGSNPPGPST